MTIRKETIKGKRSQSQVAVTTQNIYDTTASQPSHHILTRSEYTYINNTLFRWLTAT